LVETYSFGTWLKQRRKEKRLTQRELALAAACAVATIKKIEADERRPSVEIAELLADALAVPANWRDRFVACARGQRPVDSLIAMEVADQSNSPASIPTPPTPFIGRDDELAEIDGVLAKADCRLLTLVGPGGIGKTRLAIEVAYRLRDAMDDGAAFVPLATVTEASVIPTTIIRSLNLSLTSEEQLLNALRQQKMLLVLDNCEQLGDEIAWFTRLLDQAPDIKLLATSRERLQLQGEWVFSVPEMAQQQAVQLLHKSGQRVIPDLDVSEAEAASVCEVVGNLPLAVELAAGWLNFMTCKQIVQSVQRDVDFLETTMRDIPERHRSIRAVFDYSWKMLSEQEQNALMRLSVFRGGWRIEEAEAVADANLLRLRALLDKSLVRSMGEGRYDLHELIRQYATERLHESGLEAETCARHAETYIQFFKNTLTSGRVHNVGEAFQRVETELDNCRAALRWSLDNSKVETALRLLSETFVPWLRRGHWQEGERWHREALAAAGDTRSTWVCQGLTHLGTFVAVQGRYAEVSPIREQARAMLTDIDDPRAVIEFSVQAMQAEYELEDARKWFEKHVSLLQDWEHPMRDSQLSASYCLMGDRLRDSGQYAEAKAHYQKSLELDKALTGMMGTYTSGNLGRLALQEGNLQEAHNLITHSVTLSRSIGSRVSIADWTRCLGEVWLFMGNLTQAEVSFEESMALYEEIGNIRGVTDLISCLAHTAILQENWNIASERLRMSLASYLRILREFHSLASDHASEHTTPFVNALFCTAILSTQRKRDVCAAIIIGRASLLREKDPMRPEPQLKAHVEDATEQVRQRLGEVRFAVRFQAGRSMPTGDLLEYALECL
jgi:predicted ATPase/DNA-binding XRE family transcriptional regulator